LQVDKNKKYRGGENLKKSNAGGLNIIFTGINMFSYENIIIDPTAFFNKPNKRN